MHCNSYLQCYLHLQPKDRQILKPDTSVAFLDVNFKRFVKYCHNTSYKKFV